MIRGPVRLSALSCAVGRAVPLDRVTDEPVRRCRAELEREGFVDVRDAGGGLGDLLARCVDDALVEYPTLARIVLATEGRGVVADLLGRDRLRNIPAP